MPDTDTQKLLRDIARALTSAQLSLTETFPTPDELDEWLKDWDVPQEHHGLFRKLSAEAEDAYERVDYLERQVRTAINDLEKKS